MSFGDLRKEIFSDFAEFLSAQGFTEVFYDYNERVFGNEILQFENDGFGIQFTRDRSVIDIELKKKHGLYEPIHIFLEELGLPRPPFSFDYMPKHSFGYELLIPQWPRLSRLLTDQS
jgi:hypothetical protein